MVRSSLTRLFNLHSRKILPAFLFLIVFIAGSVAFSVHSQSNETENSNSLTTDSSPTPTPTPHTLVGTFYTTENNIEAKLLLNNKGITQLEVRPTLYNLQGQELQLPSVWVEPQNFRFINLRDWAMIGGDTFKSGSIKLFHVGKDLVLGSQIYLTDETHSVSYEEKLAEIGKFDSRRQEAVWQIPTAQTTTVIALSNTSDAPLTVSGRLGKAPRITGVVNTFQLAAHETKVLDVQRDFSDGNQFFNSELMALSLTHNGASKDALLARVLVADPTRGFSNVVQFSNPAGGSSSEYQGVGFQIENINNQILTPVIVARNVGTATATVTAKVPYTRTDGTKGTITLPTKQLAAGEIGALNVSSITRRVQQEQIKVASLEVTYNTAAGSLIVAAHTVSADKNLVFRVPMWDPLGQRSPTGGYPWRIEGTSVTETYIKNITDQEQDYVAFLVWENGGMYMIGMKPIAGHETVHIDVKKIRDDQVPDFKGRTIPSYVSSGQLQWTLRRKDNLPDDDIRTNLALIGRSEQVDIPRGIINNYACQNCCSGGFINGYVAPANPFASPEIEVGSSLQLVAYQVDETCYGNPYEYPYIVPATWSSNNTNIATVSSGGEVAGIAEGDASIRALWRPRISVATPPCPPPSPSLVRGIGSAESEEECEQSKRVINQKSDELPDSPNIAACGSCTSRTINYDAYFGVRIVPKVVITINRDGNPITSTQEVVVGQQIRLSANVTGGTVLGKQWSIPGTRIANYKVTCVAGTSRCVSGVVTELNNLNDPSVDFYWVDGGNSRQVTYNVTVGTRQYSKTAVFNVARPTVNVSRALGFVGVRLEDDTYWWLRLGEPEFPGISFTASSFSGPQGIRAFAQIARPIRRFQLSDGNWCRYDAQGIDGTFPYPSSTSNSAEDSPGSTLNNGDLKSTANDTFKMFYMFKPTVDSGATIWVPLKVVNWSWSGEALPINATDWRLDTSSKNADAAMDTTDFPQWTTNAAVGVYVPEGGTHSCPN